MVYGVGSFICKVCGLGSLWFSWCWGFAVDGGFLFSCLWGTRFGVEGFIGCSHIWGAGAGGVMSVGFLVWFLVVCVLAYMVGTGAYMWGVWVVGRFIGRHGCFGFGCVLGGLGR